MKFDKQKYLSVKQTVIDLIKESHAWETTEGFIADGIICPDIYEKEQIKILVILAESYGYSDSQFIDIEEQMVKDIIGIGDSEVQTPKKVATLLWLLLKSIEKGHEIEWENFPNLLQNNNFNFVQLQEVISKIAWINIKKASKIIDQKENLTTHLDYMDIYNNGSRNKKIIELQIESIAPDLIIVFSDPVIHCLYDNKILGEGIERDTKYVIQTNLKGQKIICMTHPAYVRDWGYESIYQKFQILYEALC